MTVNTSEKALDMEWFELILEARNLGINIEEIKEFLNESSKN
jgi:DNA-binding transcriptional MerR regulator